MPGPRWARPAPATKWSWPTKFSASSKIVWSTKGGHRPRPNHCHTGRRLESHAGPLPTQGPTRWALSSGRCTSTSSSRRGPLPTIGDGSTGSLAHRFGRRLLPNSPTARPTWPATDDPGPPPRTTLSGTRWPARSRSHHRPLRQGNLSTSSGASSASRTGHPLLAVH